METISIESLYKSFENAVQEEIAAKKKEKSLIFTMVKTIQEKYELDEIDLNGNDLGHSDFYNNYEGEDDVTYAVRVSENGTDIEIFSDITGRYLGPDDYDYLDYESLALELVEFDALMQKYPVQ